MFDPTNAPAPTPDVPPTWSTEVIAQAAQKARKDAERIRTEVDKYLPQLAAAVAVIEELTEPLAKIQEMVSVAGRYSARGDIEQAIADALDNDSGWNEVSSLLTKVQAAQETIEWRSTPDTDEADGFMKL